MKSLPARTRPILVASLCLALVQCAGFFKGAGEALVSDADEAKLGAQFHNTLMTNDTARQEFPLYVPRNQAQSEFQNYILGLCQQVVAAIPDKERPAYNFTFTIIDKDVENAFAVPGGYVYIYTGILKKMKDESELVGVLGHEITHVTHHHFREALAKQATLGLALQAVLGVSNAGQAAQMGAGLAFQLAGMQFSRANERDADEGGTRITARVGRNPMGIAKYFGRAKGGAPPEWLSTHPGSPNRVRAVRKQVERDPALTQLAADSARTNYTQTFQAKTTGI